jgi:hypothetical protein
MKRQTPKWAEALQELTRAGFIELFGGCPVLRSISIQVLQILKQLTGQKKPDWIKGQPCIPTVRNLVCFFCAKIGSNTVSNETL